MITTKSQNEHLRRIQSDLKIFVRCMSEDIKKHQQSAVKSLKEQQYGDAEIAAEVADITERYFEEALLNKLCTWKRGIAVAGENHRVVRLDSLKFSMMQFVVNMIDLDVLIEAAEKPNK